MPNRPETTSQIELFECFAPVAERAPKLQLPFQANETIDLDRACSILDISRKTLIAMLVDRRIRSYSLDGVKKSLWRIEYNSVVEYCDMLCVHFGIPSRRSALKPGQKRHRDRDLLPFPKDETINIATVMSRLECSRFIADCLIENGTLTAYRLLVDTPGCIWRIHEPSLDRYIASLVAAAGK